MNSSPARIAANQANAQKSTGPVTEAGKDKVRFNAVKHGACSRTVVLPTEDKEAFVSFTESLRGIWVPDCDLAEKQFTELVECEWRLDRIRKAEFSLLALGIRENLAKFADEPDPEMQRNLAEAATWRDYHRQFGQFRRNENALLKEKDRLEGILSRMIQQRKEKLQQSMLADAQRKLAGYAALSEATFGPKSGFVPQQAPAQAVRQTTAPVSGAPSAAKPIVKG